MRGVLIDHDGVIWEGDQVVRGAPETVDWLNAQEIPHLFVTNTTSRPVRLIADKLARLGEQVSIVRGLVDFGVQHSFQHKALLLEAEQARLEARTDDAGKLYV